jgi:putative restriction endonuclease
METYFSPETQNALITQTALNIQSFVYSQELIDIAHQQIKETITTTSITPQAVRDQGFRKAIVHIYEHRCAFCGVRLLTVDGHSVVDAAHIIPWSITRNDDLHNGMALCRLCHWTFDEGLISVSQKYLVIVSPEIRISSNIPGHLITLENRSILAPADQNLYPALDALAWHCANVFRKV